MTRRRKSEPPQQRRIVTPFEIYRRLVLGPGGHAIAAARDAKAAAVEAVAAKHRR